MECWDRHGKKDLKGNPFFLDDDRIGWAEKTLADMTLEEKCGQVFCPMGFTDEEAMLSHVVRDLGVGGMMYRADFAANIQNTHRKIQTLAKIPLLLAANTEAGGDSLAFEGTSFGKPMAVSVTNDPENGYRMGLTACKEGAALGLNWSFAPIVDINYEFHNPITNVRTFGDGPEKVIDFASRYMDGADECDVAVSIIYFPGDGVDERDQHILASINSLSVEAWDKTYGRVYQTLIEKGAKTVMVGHIAMPAYVKAMNPEHPFVQGRKKRFEAEGFLVTVRDRRISITVEDFMDPSKMTPQKQRLMHEMYRSVEEMKQDYDLYVFMGRSPFTGISPIDPLCGKDYL